ncbi:MAG TPA: class I SAM-dependent methyltransferase [Chitinophagaceae bacterium]|nr:class I SAM-dependent methyltransferase [Chitinophagaceae bacterium]
MYLFIKKIVKKILPQKLVFKIEPFLRKTYSVFFRGNKYHCTVCEGSFDRFIQLKNGELLCPRCGSLPRDRRLYELLKKENLLQGKLLDFSPSRTLYRKFKKTPGVEYFSSDFAHEFMADYQFDITAIKCEDNFFDLIICYHILEHITEDRKAMRELFRVLKPGGTMLLQSPFREGEIFEDPSISTEEERHKYFGQKDHVRIYSVEGMSKRLSQAGFRVEILRFKEHSFNRSGFSEKEMVVICKK